MKMTNCITLQKTSSKKISATLFCNIFFLNDNLSYKVKCNIWTNIAFLFITRWRCQKICAASVMRPSTFLTSPKQIRSSVSSVSSFWAKKGNSKVLLKKNLRAFLEFKSIFNAHYNFFKFFFWNAIDIVDSTMTSSVARYGQITFRSNDISVKLTCDQKSFGQLSCIPNSAQLIDWSISKKPLWFLTFSVQHGVVKKYAQNKFSVQFQILILIFKAYFGQRKPLWCFRKT